jgi:tetratricopeptide (TPR) repeat protein
MVIKITDQDVDRFLRSGRVEPGHEEAIAQACDRRVRDATNQSNRKALSLSERFIKRARPHDGVLLLTALRAGGWAHLVAGRYRDALKHYLEARSLAGRDALVRGRIDRILIDVYMYLDQVGESRRRFRMAMATFTRLDLPGDMARTRVNYANVLHRQDRHEEAGTLYREAAIFFEETKAQWAAALCHYNLANTRVQLFDFEEAESLYSHAREAFQKHEDALHATACLYGLAWLHMLQGEYHQALRELTECEAAYGEGGQSRELLLCLLDRAETYLALNLFVDARRTAEQAARTAHKLKLSYEQAKAHLFAGRASAGLGRMQDARSALGKAMAGFRKGQNPGFEAAARFSLSQATRNTTDRAKLLREARRSFSKAQLPLWEALCDLQQLLERPEESRLYDRLAANPAVDTVPHLHVRWNTLRGDLAYAKEDRTAAHTHWVKAAETLDAVRAKLPPVEVRAAYLHKSADPFNRLVDTEAQRDALSASAWAERRRTGGLWTAPSHLKSTSPERQRIEVSFSALATQVAAFSGLVSPSGGRRSLGMAPATRTQKQIESRIRHQLVELTVPAQAQHNTDAVGQLFCDTSMDLPVVQFHAGATDFLAFVHHRGACHSHRFHDGIAYLSDLVAQWRFLVECSAYEPGGYASATGTDERNVLQRISRWLLPPLEIPADATRLLVIPEGSLAALPWPALQHGSGMLVDRHELILAPSLCHYAQARTVHGRSSEGRIFVGNRAGLEHVDAELSALRDRMPGEKTTVFDPCCRADWPSEGASRFWHYTGHATLRADNPFYSALELSDGPLFAADLRLKRHQVDLVTLAACRTGPHTHLPGDEATGLVRSLLEMGARNVVASHWAVADRSTARWMDLFYKHFLDGETVSRSVRQTALKMREEYPRVYHWGAFSAFGCG